MKDTKELTAEKAPDAAFPSVITGATYRHYKGARYVALAVALESTNGRPRERMVVYMGEQLNVRTEREFTEWLDDAGCRRFKLCPAELWLPVPALPTEAPSSPSDLSARETELLRALRAARDVVADEACRTGHPSVIALRQRVDAALTSGASAAEPPKEAVKSGLTE